MPTISEADDKMEGSWMLDWERQQSAKDAGHLSFVALPDARFERMKPEYVSLIDNMSIKPGWIDIADRTARRIIANKPKYLEVQAATSVPWQMISVIHHMEGNGSFDTHLANGDSLQYRTTHVPAGRIPHLQPPYTFLQGAEDALAYEGLTTVTDWSLAHMAYLLEGFNGFGYRGRGVNSPYLWSGTNNYTVGKFIADGQYDPSAISGQLGAMALLSRVVALDLTSNQIVAASAKLSGVASAQVGGAGIAGIFTLDKLNYFPSYISQIKMLGLSSSELILVVAGILTFIGASLLIYRGTGDYATGLYTPRSQPENPVTGNLVIK